MTSSNGNIPVLLALCAGNSSVTGEFPAQKPVTRSFDVLLNCAWINGCANSRQAGDLRRHRVHYDVIVMQKYRLWWYNRMSGMEYAKFADSKRQPNCHRSDDRTLWKYVKSYQGTSITIVFVSLYLKCHLWHCTPSKHRILSGVLIPETQGMQ